jgi:hypothetical protein
MLRCKYIHLDLWFHFSDYFGRQVVKVLTTALLVRDNFAGFNCQGKTPQPLRSEQQPGLERATSMSAMATTSLRMRMAPLFAKGNRRALGRRGAHELA